MLSVTLVLYVEYVRLNIIMLSVVTPLSQGILTKGGSVQLTSSLR
jgi:hypothetical protein